MRVQFLVFVIFFLTNINAQSQNKKQCAVNLVGLDQTYDGECKKGLAHGDGTAEGTLGKYVGQFRKGFPHGTGKMEYKSLSGDAGTYYEGEWARGMKDGQGTYFYSKDSILTGFWEEDRYIGLYDKDYIVNARGPLRHRFSQIADSPNNIEIQFVRDGVRQMQDIVSLSAQNSSGSELRQNSYFGYEQVEYPFEGRLIMTINNTLRTSSYTAEFTYTIYKSGKWLIVIDY